MGLIAKSFVDVHPGYFCKGDETGVCEAETDGDSGMEGVKVPISTHMCCRMFNRP